MHTYVCIYTFLTFLSSLKSARVICIFINLLFRVWHLFQDPGEFIIYSLLSLEEVNRGESDWQMKHSSLPFSQYLQKEKKIYFFKYYKVKKIYLGTSE